MFSPAHQPALRSDPVITRALNGMRQIHPAIPPIRPASAATRRVLMVHRAHDVAAEVRS